MWVGGGCVYNAYWVSGQRAHHYRELTVSCELRGERGSTITELMATLERWQVGGGGGGGELRYSLNYPRCCPGDLHYHIPTPYLTQHSAFYFNNLLLIQVYVCSHLIAIAPPTASKQLMVLCSSVKTRIAQVTV